MSRIVDNLAELIGNTPMLRLDRLAPDGVELLAKMEFMNPGHSIKDRPILEILDAAEARGELRPGMTLIEASSGNTGIALSLLAAERGYACVVVMPEDMSIERRNLMRAYGARIELSDRKLGMGGSMARVRELGASLRAEGVEVFMTEQFDNLDNTAAHEKTTAIEILEQCEGRLDVLVAGIGTGGTLTGTARAIKPRLPGLKVIGVEPIKAQAFKGQPFKPHLIQGIGAGFIPSIVDHAVIDEVVAVHGREAVDMATSLSHSGILVGPSSGANVVASLAIAATVSPGTRIVTFLCDSGERYLS